MKKMKMYTFFVEPSVIRDMKHEVRVRGFDSVSAFIRMLISDYFAKKHNEKPKS